MFKKQPENINDLRRIFAVNSHRQQELRDRISRLRDELRPLRWQPVLRSESTVSKLDLKPNEVKLLRTAEAEREAAVVRIEAQLAPLEAELIKISDVIVAAQTKINEFEHTADRERRLGVARAVEAAGRNLSAREEYIAARGKLAGLQKHLDDAEIELDRVYRIAEVAPVTNTSRAQKLIETGELDTNPVNLDGGLRIKELRLRIGALAEAVRIQDGITRAAQNRFARELIGNLKPEMTEIVGTLVDSYEKARDAMVRARLLNVAIAVETCGSNECMPPIEFPGVQFPAGLGIADSFTMFADRQRLEGLL